MLQLNARDQKVVELLAQGCDTKSRHAETYYRQMDLVQVALQNPQKPGRAQHA